MKPPKISSDSYYRYLPFLVFMGFIGIEEIAAYLFSQNILITEKAHIQYIYPVKTLVTAFLLFRFRHHYHEIVFGDLKQLTATLVSLITGIAVFVLWIHMDWTIGTTLVPAGFDPFSVEDDISRYAMILFRVSGAVILVPIMEELFWRSFLIRYIIVKNFDTIRIGTYTATSFIVTVILFGLEHNYIFAGMMAGAAYNILLYKYRSIAQCIFAHAVTNLILALYVLNTSKWNFW